MSIARIAQPVSGSGHKREAWLPAVPESARTARSLVREAAVQVGLDADRTWDLTLAASEAFANAVEHGEPWPDGSLLLMTEPCWRGLRVEVCDLGTFDATLAPAPLDATCGRGLQIIATLVDRLEVRQRGGAYRRTVREAPRPGLPRLQPTAATDGGRGVTRCGEPVLRARAPAGSGRRSPPPPASAAPARPLRAPILLPVAPLPGRPAHAVDQSGRPAHARTLSRPRLAIRVARSTPLAAW